MMPNWVINPRLMQTIAPILNTSGTIQVATEVRDAAGQPIKNWVDLAWATGIACHIETIGGTETKAINQIYATATHEITLGDFYPLITPKMRLVDAGGSIYDILLVDQEAFGVFTKLVAEIKR